MWQFAFLGKGDSPLGERVGVDSQEGQQIAESGHDGSWMRASWANRFGVGIALLTDCGV
jgi:hypothetical protein